MAGLRRGPGGDGAIDSWQMTYCSVIMILVAIFMMIISYSKIEGKKMSGALSRTVATKLQGTPGPQRGGLDNPTEDLIESAMTELKQAMAREGMGEKHSLSRTKAGIRLSVASDLFFSSGAPTLREGAHPALDAIVSVMKETPFLVGIAAHSDVHSSQSGDSRSSWETTALRAGLILRYLSEKGGLPLRRLVSAGFGSYRSSPAGLDPQGALGNERVEFLFELPESPAQDRAG
jgi:hypothetical protein